MTIKLKNVDVVLDGTTALIEKKNLSDEEVGQFREDSELKVFDGSDGGWCWNYCEDGPTKTWGLLFQFNANLAGIIFETQQECIDAHNKDLLVKRYTDYWEAAWGDDRFDPHRSSYAHLTWKGDNILTSRSDTMNLPKLALYSDGLCVTHCYETFTQEEINEVVGWD